VHVHSPALQAIVQRPSQRALHFEALHSNWHVAFAAQVGVHVARLQLTLQLLPDSHVGAHVVALHSRSHDLPPPQVHEAFPQIGFVLVEPASVPPSPIVKSSLHAQVTSAMARTRFIAPPPRALGGLPPR
jgi:hypothetical protein